MDSYWTLASSGHTTSSTEAELALDQAMMRVSEEMEYIYPELAGEFATVVMQVRAGQERTERK